MKRNPKWVIYTSSYDRGLEHLLKMWPEIVKEVPDAHLHIFYGWQLFEKFYKNNPASMSWMKNMIKMMDHPNITHHGRVTQKEVEKWTKKCGLWAYPTHFGEISCISAMKAQAYGAIPVVVNYAALDTTVKYGKKIEGDIYESNTKLKFKRDLISSLKDDVWQNALRPEMMKWAKKEFGWDKIAGQWSKEFHANNKKD